MTSTQLFSILVSISFSAQWIYAEPSIACPTPKDAKALTEWRSSAISKIVNKEYVQVQSDIKECFEDKIPSCLSDMNYYVDHKINGPLSSEEMDSLYEDKMTIKSESFLPKELLLTDSSGEIKPGFVKIPENFYEIAKEKKWLAAGYKTRELGGFDDSNNLFIMAIPSAERDTVLQLSIAKDATPFASILDPIARPHDGNVTRGFATLTIITVDKTKNPPVGQLRLLKKDYNQENTYIWSKNTNTIGSRSCVGCHATPFRAISPVGYKNVNNLTLQGGSMGNEMRMDPEQASTIEKINEILSRPGVTWGSAVKNGREIRFGPDIDSQPWGWAPANSITRQKEFIEKCSSERQPIFHMSRAGSHYRVDLKPNTEAPISWEKVSNAMNCVSCHNGKTRGVIHSGFAPSTIAFKIAVSREMPESDDPENPLPPDLNADERMALVWCLKKEKETVAEEWKKSGAWMQRTKCK